MRPDYGPEEIPALLLALAKLRRVARRHGRIAVQGLRPDIAVHEVRLGQARRQARRAHRGSPGRRLCRYREAEGRQGDRRQDQQDHRPLGEDDPGLEQILERPQCAWIDRDVERKAQGYAVANVVPEHLAEVRDAKLALITKTEVAVKDRLTKEIAYWDHRAEQLKLQEQAGKTGARLNSGEARKRADTLQTRLQKRLEELQIEAQISPLPPVVLGGLLVVPKGLIDEMSGREPAGTRTAVDTQESAARARKIIMDVERSLGFDPADREFEKLGYDIESRVPDTGKLRFIEVKGRDSGASTITVTRNEVLYSLNKPEAFILGIVEFQDDGRHQVHYVREPFQREPDFGVTSVNYDFAELLARAGKPS